MSKDDREMSEYLAGMLAYFHGFSWSVFKFDQYDAIRGWFHCSFREALDKAFPDDQS